MKRKESNPQRATRWSCLCQDEGGEKSKKISHLVTSESVVTMKKTGALGWEGILATFIREGREKKIKSEGECYNHWILLPREN